MALVPLAAHADLATGVLMALVVGIVAIRELASEQPQRDAPVLQVTALLSVVGVGAIGAVLLP